MTKEQVKEEVKKVIVPLCFNEVSMEWDVVADMNLLVEVVEEIISEDEELRDRMTEKAGKVCDIGVSWECGGGRPRVSVYYNVKPEVREVNFAELDVFIHQWQKNDYDYICMSANDIELSPEWVAKLVKSHYYKQTFTEIVYAGGQIIARHLKDKSRKLYCRNEKKCDQLYHEAMFGENGVISKMM